jgi:hypothetical protein
LNLLKWNAGGMLCVTNLTLAREELESITGYRAATRQLAVLHSRGFTRAYICRAGGVVLERAHYDAVCRGEYGGQHRPAKAANLDFLRRQA